jgi:TRAP-type uncharacterized transport system fused permease subunit
MFVYRPALLLMGSFSEIVSATVISVAGTGALVASLNGYFLGRAKIWERLLYGIGGILLIFPGWITMLGLGMIVLAVASQIITKAAAKKLEETAIQR